MFDYPSETTEPTDEILEPIAKELRDVIYRFNFPAQPTSKVHAENSGVTHFTPTYDIQCHPKCAGVAYQTAWGDAPSKLMIEISRFERTDGVNLSIKETIAFITKQTGLHPVIIKP